MSAQVDHLRPTTALAPRAIVCGDPGRCLALATALTERPLMFNHARGLWGYTGTAADGEPLTIQATGLGAASAAIITDELCRLGVQRLVRVGTARALRAGDGAVLAPGSVLAASAVLAADGPSRALGAGERVAPDPALSFALDRPARLIASADLLAPGADLLRAWTAAGAAAVDLQSAAVLRAAERHEVPAAAVLVVTGTAGAPVALDDEALAAAVLDAATAAVGALGVGVTA